MKNERKGNNIHVVSVTRFNVDDFFLGIWHQNFNTATRNIHNKQHSI